MLCCAVVLSPIPFNMQPQPDPTTTQPFDGICLQWHKITEAQPKQLVKAAQERLQALAWWAWQPAGIEAIVWMTA